MINKALILSENKFKNAAKRMKHLVSEKGYNQCLQLLSQSFFSKPFEEIQKTLFSNNDSNDTFQVFLIHYEEEILLTLNEGYITDLGRGSDNELSSSDILNEAKILAKEYNCEVNNIYLPSIFGEYSYSVENLISLSKKMGYFSKFGSIFDLLSLMNIKIFVNDIYCPYTISDDWHDKCYEEGEDACVWYIEMNEEYNFYEFFPSFKDLCKATTEDGITWWIPNGKYFLKVDIFTT